MTPSTFTVIITTYKRPDAVMRSVQSVTSQSYQNWQLYVVIDDTESDYNTLKSLHDPGKTNIIQNQTNVGKNASVNRVLDILAEQNFGGYIIFLDDDDWLAPNCLADFATHQIKHPDQAWLVSQRASSETGVSYTTTKKPRSQFSYTRDCLLLRTFTGDATHCISFPEIKAVRFPYHIKNAEEWIYFAAIVKHIPLFSYLPVTGTLSPGYAPDGLTQQYSHINRWERNKIVLTELKERGLLSSPYVLLYLLGRYTKTILYSFKK